MDLPLCKICGERHRLGFCPKFSGSPSAMPRDPASERRRWLRAMTGPARVEPVATVAPKPALKPAVPVKLPSPVQHIEADHQREDRNPNREVGGVHGLSLGFDSIEGPVYADRVGGKLTYRDYDSWTPQDRQTWPKPKFDKRAYQRELMRTRRAKAKEATS